MPVVDHELAKICHQANKAYCETLGDFSQKDWEQAEPWQRESMIAGVQFVMLNRQVEIAPQALHDAWLEKKTADGWTYGPEKNAEKKTHPCCRPWGELPPEQRKKDELFAAIAGAFLKRN